MATGLEETHETAPAHGPAELVPEPPPVTWAVPDGPELVDLIESFINKAGYERAKRAREAPARPHRAVSLAGTPWAELIVEDVPEDLFEELRALLVDPRPPRGEVPGVERFVHLDKAAVSPDLPPAGLLKLLRVAGYMDLDPLSRASYFFNIQHRVTGRPTLLELAHLLDDCGYDGATAVQNAYVQSYLPLGEGWADDAVWPFFARHLDCLFSFHARPITYLHDPAAFYRALGSFPELPAEAVEKLYGLALGTRKKDRRPAQDLLRQHPDRARRVVAALGDGKSEARTVAATWLARIRDPDTVPALEQAVAKERNDLVKGAILDALQALGQPVPRYLDRDDLGRTATRAVAKGLPKDLEWFPWQALPAVHWADTGDEVPHDTVKWLIAQAVKGRSPEPNALLRNYCGMFRAGDRERLGRFLLESWLAEDVRPIPEEQAIELARDQASQMYQWMRHTPGMFQGDPLLGRTVEELVAHYLPTYANQPTGSATGSKGMLAVVATCAGPDVVEPVGRYLRKWYGQRVNQCKALLAMLAWIDHPGAIQLLLSVGARFRTRSIQEEANRQAEALAERRGWTVAELADRSIPTGGFDESGVLELSYGPRVFTAHLTPALTVEVRSPDGKPVRSLPAPRATDDEAEVKAAKKALTAAKKELKGIVALQTARLYEALCTERTWPAEDWSTFLAGHVVMRHLVQRLVWTATSDDPAQPVTFRPLDDGTLTDVDDDEVKLPPEGTVAIAHDSNLPADQVAAWQEHLSDYEVRPLFQQFGKGTYRLSEERRNALAIDDFKGHMLETYALRGRATKLGYTRGPAEDGGFFYEYRKSFPTLGITAVIRFTGNPLPEENRDVALTELTFEKSGLDGHGTAMPLGDVPAVLLSEAWNDMRLAAAEGTGFDPDWERKSGY